MRRSPSCRLPDMWNTRHVHQRCRQRRPTATLPPPPLDCYAPRFAESCFGIAWQHISLLSMETKPHIFSDMLLRHAAERLNIKAFPDISRRIEGTAAAITTERIRALLHAMRQAGMLHFHFRCHQNAIAFTFPCRPYTSPGLRTWWTQNNAPPTFTTSELEACTSRALFVGCLPRYGIPHACSELFAKFTIIYQATPIENGMPCAGAPDDRHVWWGLDHAQVGSRRHAARRHAITPLPSRFFAVSSRCRITRIIGLEVFLECIPLIYIHDIGIRDI